MIFGFGSMALFAGSSNGVVQRAVVTVNALNHNHCMEIRDYLALNTMLDRHQSAPGIHQPQFRLAKAARTVSDAYWNFAISVTLSANS